MSTYSEAYQDKFKRKDCPCILDCGIEVTRDYFIRICKRDNYTSCQHFAKRYGELQEPIKWLQKQAIEQTRNTIPDTLASVE
jgi:hypothetical protein